MNKLDEIEEALKKLELLRLRASTHASISNCKRTMQDWIDSDAEFISKALTQLAALRGDYVMVPRAVVEDIQAISHEYRRQVKAVGYFDTPGGIENPQDAFDYINKWAEDIAAAQTKEKPND